MHNQVGARERISVPAVRAKHLIGLHQYSPLIIESNSINSLTIW